MDSWQLKQILKLYIYFVVKTTSSVKLFDKKVTIQKFHNGRNDFIAHVFVYKWVFTVFRKKEKKKLTKPFPCLELFHWKWMPIENECELKMNAHFEKEPHFENESIFLEKWKAINPFLKKLQIVLRKNQECLLAPNLIDWYFLIQSSSL